MRTKIELLPPITSEILKENFKNSHDKEVVWECCNNSSVLHHSVPIDPLLPRKETVSIKVSITPTIESKS